MNVNQFAEKFRLQITRDECGDPIIAGKRGHLYFAGADLCLMVVDGAIANRSCWEALGGHLWLGDISRDKAGRRVQDVWIKGIPLENAPAAIRMVQCGPKRVLSPEECETRRARLPKRGAVRRKRPSPALETLAGPHP